VTENRTLVLKQGNRSDPEPVENGSTKREGSRKMPADLQDEQLTPRASVLEAICTMLAEVMPEHWRTVTLTLTPRAEFGQGLSHTISSPEGHEESVPPPPGLLEATKRLERCWTDRDATFRRAVISATRDSKDWRLSIDYDL